MRLRVRRVSVIGLSSESRVRLLSGGSLALGDIIALLTYFHLANGGVSMYQKGMSMYQKGVSTYHHPL